MKDILESNYIKILKGTLISWIITLVLLFIYAVLLTYTKIGENTASPVIIAITAVSILIRKFYCN
ncbi:MAG: TIGR04086 family membrane protein [Clostridia bacterium]|nr:TIGR04086 family membrane protein [Clostridia bacterium]